MKTVRKLALGLLAGVSANAALALSPVSTFTFVDPCQRFMTGGIVPQTHNCYSFAITNPSATDQDSYYTWNFGNGQTAQGMEVSYCYPANLSGTHYTVSLGYNSPGCGMQVVLPAYVATLSPYASTNCAGDASVTLSGFSATACCLSSGPIIPEIVYEYNFGDGSATSFTNTHTYGACGNFIITTHQYDMNNPSSGCYDYVAVNILCAPTGTVTGIEKRNLSTGVHVFPNPATTALSIVSSAPVKHIRVFDLLGRQMINADVKDREAQMTLNIESLNAGAYIMVLSSDEGVQNLKFIKH